MRRHYLLATIAAVFMLAVSAFAQKKVEFTYLTKDFRNWGTSKAETYNVAILVDNPYLEGLKVTGMRVPLQPKLKNVSGLKVFLTSKLEQVGTEPVIDICSQEFTQTDTWTTVKLDEPYTIGKEPFYAGVSFTVDKAVLSEKKPLFVCSDVNPKAFFVLFSKSYREWCDLSEKFHNLYPLILSLEGDVCNVAAQPMSASDVRSEVNKEGLCEITVANLGMNTVESIDYTISVNGTEMEGHYDFGLPIANDYIGKTQTINIKTPAVAQEGRFEGKLTITKVNGVENGRPDASVDVAFTVVDFLPVHRALMEEFTGTWCQFCPAGWVAIEKMKERHPDDFIAIAYHANDIMQITSDLPVPIDGYPDATIDRVGATMHPYYGTNYEQLGVEQDWLNRCAKVAPVSLDAEAVYDTDRTKLYITTKMKFIDDLQEHPYRLAYFVTADGLKGEGNEWLQMNAFQGAGPEFEPFSSGPSPIAVEYNDVLIAKTANDGIEGSIPATVTAMELMLHTHSFNIADMKSATRPDVSLVQDINRLNGIVAVVNTATGEIENAFKCGVKESTTGISSLQDDKSATPVAAYGIDGTLVGNDHKGLTIIRMSDGTVRKVIRK